MSQNRWWSRPLMYLIGISSMFFGSTIVKQCNNDALFVNPVKDDWATTKKIINEASKQLVLGDSSQLAYSQCLLSTIQAKYPNGEATIPKDSSKNLYLYSSRDCVISTKNIHINTNSDLYLSSIRAVLNQSPFVLGMNEKDKTPFCDCFISELKSVYPVELIGQIPENTGSVMAKDCAAKLGYKIP